MLFQPARAGDFIIIRLLQDTFGDDDIAALKHQIEEYLQNGKIKIALKFLESAYPYSKLISLITQCHQLVEKQNGSLAVIVPGDSFVAAADSVNLSSVVQIVSSEEEL